MTHMPFTFTDTPYTHKNQLTAQCKHTDTPGENSKRSDAVQSEAGDSNKRSGSGCQKYHLPVLQRETRQELGSVCEDRSGQHWYGQHLLRG